MNKSKFLTTLALFGLMVTGCGQQPQSSAAPSSQAPQPSSSAAPSSSVAPSSSQEEVTELYYAQPFGFEGKWEKDHEYSWTFDVKENHAEMTFAFGAMMTSSSHGNRSLFTNHDGASAEDTFESNAANDGTPRITVTVNGEPMCLTRDTYEEAGLDTADINYFRVAKFGVRTGPVVVTLKTHATAGYRLSVGGDARLYYPKTEPTAAEGYKVTFASTHCKIYTYDVKTTTGEGVTATEVVGNTPFISKDETGTVTKYVVPTSATEEDDIKPQVNFKIVCDDGYIVSDENIVISGSQGNEWNNLKAQGNGFFRITKIKADIKVTVTPVEGSASETPEGYKVTFQPTHCSIVVYAGKYGEEGTTVDNGPDFYSRNKDNPAEYAKGDAAQVNFKVVPENGYEVTGNSVTVTGTYNNIKAGADDSYNITKVGSDLTIAVVCTVAQQISGTEIAKNISDVSGTTTDETQVTSLTLNEVITVSVNGDGNNGKVYSSGAQWRVYQADNAVITIAAANGYVISSIKFTFSNKNTGILLYGTTALTSATAQAISPAAASVQVTCGNSEANVTNGQVRITAISVVYQAA